MSVASANPALTAVAPMHPGPQSHGRRGASPWRAVLALPAVLALSACAGTYFKDASEAPAAPVRHALDALPFDGYWTGVVFNGAKIGFTRLQIRALDDDEFELRSEAALRFRFLTVDKRVTLKAVDRVGGDLTVRGFAYDYDLDGNRLALEGSARDGALEVTVRSRDTEDRQRHAPGVPVHPAGVIALYPVVHGLAVGRRYEYLIYDGETQQLANVAQEVLAFETSELFDGPAFRVRTRLHGQEVTTWIGLDGRPVLERSMNGVFLSGIESESMARRHLTLAALNKDEALLEFSVVRVDRPIVAPRAVSAMTVELAGVDGLQVPSDALQACARGDNGVRCTVTRQVTGGVEPSPRWLESTLPAPSRDPRVRRLALEIADGLASDTARVEALVAWIGTNVEQTAVDVFSALDVLVTRKAECQGNTYLYTALARALGIPTRVVNGLAYSELAGGFVWHTWAESVVDGRWRRVDPTFGQAIADATHVKLLEGETLAELAPMAGLIGRVQARLVAVQ